MKKVSAVYILWIVMVMIWNFGWPQARPIEDVVGAVLIATSALVLYFKAIKNAWSKGGAITKNAFVKRQQKEKEENKRKILELLRGAREISNDDVEKSLDISDATATNYFQELENEEKIVQIGRRGRSVKYRLK